MNYSSNLRNLVSLSGAVRRAHLPRLWHYAVCNRLYRVSGLRLMKTAKLDFGFGAFQLAANTGDLGTIGEIFVQSPYQAFPEFVPKEGDTCLDIGANIGCVSLQWRLTNRGGTIVAVEPHPVTFARMSGNFRLNEADNIEAVHAAAGSVDGEVEIIIDDGLDSMARVLGAELGELSEFNRQSTIPVRCLTIDTLVAERNFERIDLLKIDVEGFEVECLRGAARSLTVTDKVVLEFHSDALRESCRAILATHGFECRIHEAILFARRPLAG